MEKFFLVLSLLFITNMAFAQQSSLAITVSGITHDSGSIVVAVFDSADNWLSTDADTAAFAHASQGVSGEAQVSLLIEDIPTGSYALSIFHDVNANDELDTNFIGYPQEPFGFSAPMGAFGPPNFHEASIEVKSGLNEITIAID
ncbi:MAG: hypothetical protein ACJA0M_001064 [Chitinophagales bacterium]|jgi:uncharacterized protein (DUF2141 family)